MGRCARCDCGAFTLTSGFAGQSCTVQIDGLCVSTSFGDFPILPYASTVEAGYFCAITIPKALPGGGSLAPIHKAGEPAGSLTGTFLYSLILIRPYVGPGGGFLLGSPMYRQGPFGGTWDEGCIVVPTSTDSFIPYIGKSVVCANDMAYNSGYYTWLGTTTCDPLAIDLTVAALAKSFSWTIKNI